MMKLMQLIIVALGLGMAPVATSQTLNNVQLFSRCYAQLTQLRPASNHPQLLLVRDSAKDPITACMEIFDKARLTADNNTKIADAGDVEAKAVMRTLHKLHTTWFSVRDSSNAGGNISSTGTRDMVDMESPALYFTRALFKPATRFSDVVTGAASLRAIRTTMDPTNGPQSNQVKSEFIFGAQTRFAGVGELLGVRDVGFQEFLRSYSYTIPNQVAVPPVVTSGSIDMAAHYGGGVLTDQAYLLLNFGLIGSFTANGAEKMARRYGRAMFNDMLCRSLPVIRTEDAVPFVVPSSPVAFRGSSGCVRCHASMDRATAAARNFTYTIRGHGLATPGSGLRGVETLVPIAVTQLAEAAWPTAADANYYKRPPNGVLYFRNLRGELVNTNVASLAQMGAAIAAQDDFYACAAKRYYNYFTGIDVDIGDVDDPAAAIWLSPRDEYHRAKVIQLGATLKTGQNARALIEAILRLPAYRRTDFGARLTQ